MQVQSILLVLLCATLAVSLPSPVPGNIFSATIYPTVEFNSPNSETVWKCGDEVTVEFTVRNYKRGRRAQPTSLVTLRTDDNHHVMTISQKLIERSFVEDPTTKLHRSTPRLGQLTFTTPKWLSTGKYHVYQELIYWKFDHTLKTAEKKIKVETKSKSFHIICNNEPKWSWLS